MKIEYLICLTSLFACLQSYGQEYIGSNGQSDTTGNIQVDWNLGEPIIGTAVLANTVFTQGFEQPHFIISSIEKNNNGFFPVLTLYPNPTSDKVTVSLSEETSEIITVSFYNTQGKLLFTEELIGTSKSFDLNPYPAATYQMVVNTKSNSYFENFNIIKSY